MKNEDNNNVPFGPIGMRKETWIRFGYALTTLERAFMDIKEIEDKKEQTQTYNEIVSAIALMTAALQTDILTGDIPENVTIQ